MKVLLLNPPSNCKIETELPNILNEKICLLPPLGLMYLKAFMNEKSEHKVSIVDLSRYQGDFRRLRRYLIELKPELVGITCYTHSLLDVFKLVKQIRTLRPDVHICVGGPHVNIYNQYSKYISGVDSVIAGECEESFCRLADSIQACREPQGIDGLVYRGKRMYPENRPFSIIDNLDRLPFPYGNAEEADGYFHISNGSHRIATMITSRGCPYRCIFCSTYRTKYRSRSVENIMDEVSRLRDMGYDNLYFLDDVFNIDSRRVKQICREMMKRKIEVRWTFRARVDNVDYEMLQLCKSAGCIRIHFGVETSSDEGLSMLKKGTTTKQSIETFGLCKKLGIETVAYFMIGCPHERSTDDVKRTIMHAIELAPDYALFGILTPYPGTEIYRMAVQRGIFDEGIWKDYMINPTVNFRPPLWTEHLDRKQLNNLLKYCYVKFYFRPGYILRRILACRGIALIFSKAKAAFGIIRSMRKEL